VLIVSPPTASALSPHAAEHAWIMFVQVSPPSGLGPILIEAVRGSEIGRRLAQLARDNAYEAMLIGLIESPTPAEHAAQIHAQWIAAHLHDHWFEPAGDLMAFIEHTAQRTLSELLSQAHPGAMNDQPVGIDEMAKILGCSTQTIRRMVKAQEIPFLRADRSGGRVLRFVPIDVIASLRR